MKLLTVTVPCYNSAAYMRNCIESLLVGGDRVEIIIVNDGSKDETGAIADEYVSKYPNICKAIHQENGGHGAGINQGLKNATGKYFKVVDSDDKMSDDFVHFLDTLENCGADLVVTNYYYTHTDKVGDRAIRYANALKPETLLSWNDVKRFQIHQMFTLHSSTFRTECMRKSGMDLPLHVFYEDNLMVCSVLPYVEKIYYMDINLYLYTIGREGQSVAEEATIRNYSHQLLVTERCLEAVSKANPQGKQLNWHLKHELFMMYSIAVSFTRLNNSKKTDMELKEMWERCAKIDKKRTNYFRYKTPLIFMGIPGAFGRFIVKVLYRIAHKVVRFN